MSRRTELWPPSGVDAAVRHPDAPAPGTHLPPHYDGCFGCGDGHEGGLRLRATVAEGETIESRFTVTEDHQGAPGLAHGGLLACAFDEALGTAVGTLLRMPAVTGRLETDFVRPVPVGTTLFIDVQLDGIAGRKVYVSARGRLDSADGALAVRARGLFVIVDTSHFTRHSKAGRDGAARRPIELNP